MRTMQTNSRKFDDGDRLFFIYCAMRRGITFSKTQAAKIVGGRYVLERLVAARKIRMVQPHQKQNSRWQCNGEDVLRHAMETY